MRFAKIVFLVAGIYGLAALAPLYFLEGLLTSQTKLPFNHPEYFYGFLGVALSWQIVFLIIASNPLRYRPIMYAACLEKLSFAVAVPILFAQNRVPLNMVAAAAIDAVFLLLFITALMKTRKKEVGREEKSSSEPKEQLLHTDK